jgi:hypothetical protein
LRGEDPERDGQIKRRPGFEFGESDFPTTFSFAMLTNGEAITSSVTVH